MRKQLPEKLEAGRIRSGPYGSDASYGACGAFDVHGPCGERLRIISSGADASDADAHAWEHVSVSTHRRTPNWREMAFVKDLFWEDEETVVQFHPPKSEYIDLHPYCLHLWRWTKGDFPAPPAILVGPKKWGEWKKPL
jgi:hypothetical protein